MDEPSDRIAPDQCPHAGAGPREPHRQRNGGQGGGDFSDRQPVEAKLLAEQILRYQAKHREHRGQPEHSQEQRQLRAGEETGDERSREIQRDIGRATEPRISQNAVFSSASVTF